MSDALAKYRELEARLVHIRWIHRGLESQEEDEILDKMDGAWSRLSAQEQSEVNAAPPRSLLQRERAITRTTMDTDVWLYRELPPRSMEAA
ncbi:hypothetical protein WMF45_50015 [Sorangium sp. So ce448]|uniref:hypothetical protein n=1 Tax=unclassified Sorangium TaxID=2621164 RepID=UPI003F5F53DB